MKGRIARSLDGEFGLIGRNSRAGSWAYKARGDEATFMKRVVALATVMLVVAAMGGGVGAVSAAAIDSGSTTPGPLFAENATTTDESNATAEGSNATTTDESNATAEGSNGTTEESNVTSDGTTGAEAGAGDDISSGAKMAGVIGAQQAEHTSAFESKTFEKSFDSGASNDSKAAVVAQSSERIQERLRVLENETETLEAAYENESISNDTYHGKMTSLTARIQALEHQANQTGVSGRTLPAAALEKRGVNKTDLAALEDRTRNATSPQAADIAKRVAGSETGTPAGPPAAVPGHTTDRPGNGSGPGSAGNQSGPPGQASGQNGSAGGPSSSNVTDDEPEQRANPSAAASAGNGSNRTSDDNGSEASAGDGSNRTND
ncbi:MAG: hypothetical protein ACOCPT_02940, partial [Halanaeroarchaeum sp.]